METLRRLRVTVSGSWQPVEFVGRARWEGVATAPEPLAALVLVREGGTIRWARSPRSDTNALNISLAIFPDESSDSRLDVVFRFNIGGEGLPMNLRLTSAAPFMFALDHHETGTPAWFARPWTRDRIDIGALFLSTADTRSARNHLWHLRKNIGAPQGFEDALNHGRTGVIEG